MTPAEFDGGMGLRQCCCAGKSVWTEQEVSKMPMRGLQDDGEGGKLALHNCSGCQCTFALQMPMVKS